jgi:hypothetical protein
MKRKIDKKIQKIMEAVEDIETGAVIHIAVEHDEGCPALKTHKLTDCNCEPEIKKMSSC